MYSILVVAQIFIGAALILLILVQHGKGADAGAAFGSGASGTVFGSAGSANFLSRSTAILATVFFAISISLAYLVNQGSAEPRSVIQDDAPTAPAIEAVPEEAAPVTEAAPVVLPDETE